MIPMPEKPTDWNDAFVWPQPPGDSEDPRAEEFEVVGVTSVDGHAPGSRFRAVIDDARKHLLFQGGHVALVAPDTLDELREKARELDIKGRSKMDRDDLERAVEEALQAQQDPAELTNPAAGIAQDDQQ